MGIVRKKKIRIGGLYKHFKGEMYRVIDIIELKYFSNDLVDIDKLNIKNITFPIKAVRYFNIKNPNQIYKRSLVSFSEVFISGIYRFTYIEELKYIPCNRCGMCFTQEHINQKSCNLCINESSDGKPLPLPKQQKFDILTIEMVNKKKGLDTSFNK